MQRTIKHFLVSAFLVASAPGLAADYKPGSFRIIIDKTVVTGLLCMYEGERWPCDFFSAGSGCAEAPPLTFCVVEGTLDEEGFPIPDD